MTSTDGRPAPTEPIVIRATIVNESTPAPTKPTGVQAVLPVLAELLKAIAWPLLALTFFIMFYAPIARTIALVFRP